MSTGTTDQHAADRAAIVAVLTELVDCWNRADGTGYGRLFTADADYIDVTGTHTQGGEAIGRLHQFLFDGPLKGSHLNGYGPAPKIAFLAPGVALIISGGNSRLAAQPEAPPERASINTTVLVRRDGTWRIRAFQNNRVMPMAGGPPPGVR